MLVCVSCASGGECGAGCSALHGCSSHRCLPAASLYSCQHPASLIPAAGSPQSLLGRHTLLLNLSELQLLDEVRPGCTATGYQPDAIFSFTVDAQQFEHGVGLDAWLRGAINPDVDTLLEIRKGRCSDLPRSNTSSDAATTEQGADFVCSDQSEPPAGNSARLTANLPPGQYYLIASTQPTFRDTPTARSPLAHVVYPASELLNTTDAMLRLDVRFVPGPRVPDCRLKQCGSDGDDAHGCGVCPAGQFCVDEQFVCRAVHCQPNCASRDCGEDGCGGQCGQCAGDTGCSRDGRCIADEMRCNGRQPICAERCGIDQYCASVGDQSQARTDRRDSPVRHVSAVIDTVHPCRLTVAAACCVGCFRTARVALCLLRCRIS